MNFKINLIFLEKPFILWSKSQDKNVNIFKTKGAFKME